MTICVLKLQPNFEQTLVDVGADVACSRRKHFGVTVTLDANMLALLV
jgi:hypothetical protein